MRGDNESQQFWSKLHDIDKRVSSVETANEVNSVHLKSLADNHLKFDTAHNTLVENFAQLRLDFERLITMLETILKAVRIMGSLVVISVGAVWAIFTHFN